MSSTSGRANVAARQIAGALLISSSLVLGWGSAPVQAQPVDVWGDAAEWRIYWTMAGAIADDGGQYQRHPRGGVAETVPPPADWVSQGFDDSHWGFASEFSPGHGQDRQWRLSGIYLRRWFGVSAPQQVRDLTLELTYRGGVVVYVNGQEVARGHLGEGELTPQTLAEPYPDEAYFHPDGTRLPTHISPDAPDAVRQQYESRIRRLDVRIPASLLRSGPNLISVGIHRSPYQVRALEGHWSGAHHSLWSTTGLNSARLRAASDAGLQLPVDAPPRLWNASGLTIVGHHARSGDPFAPLRPLSVSVPRNGTASAQVGVDGLGAEAQIEARVSDLVGPDGARLPADGVMIRYALHDPQDTAHPYDALSPTAPRGQLLVPVWLTVAAPSEARPGVYRGTLQFVGQRDAGGGLEVPVEVRVHEWQAPDPKDFQTWSALFQSPQSLADHYAVPLWSDEHFALIEQSLRHLGAVGNKLAAVPAQRDMSMLQGAAMLLLRRNADGELVPDLRIIERYLRLYDRHVGEPSVLILHAWTGYNDPSRTPRPATIPMSELRGRQIVPIEIPNFGEPGSEELWRRVIVAMRDLVAQLGWNEDCLVLGTPSDARPSEQTMAMFRQAADDMRWVVYSHHAGPDPRGVDIYPARHGRGQGWTVRDPYRLTNHRGILHQDSALARYRIAAIHAIRDGFNGVSGKGIDFLVVTRDDGGRSDRFVDMREWMRVVRGATRSMLAPGPDGLLATTRFEMYREGFQDAEAYILIESHKDDPRLSPQLAARARAIRPRVDGKLAAFTAFIQEGTNPDADWRSDQDELYECAAGIARAIAEASSQPVSITQP